MDFLFEEGWASRVQAYLDTGNDRSRRLLESLGFAKIGFIKDADTIRGRPSDEFVYELSRAPAASTAESL